MCIELTEDDFFHLGASAAHEFDRLKTLGLRSAIDDFGTGSSSLRHLYRFQVDVLKIDGSFVRGLGQRPEAEAVVRAVVGLARDLRRTTVAEGAEAAEQVELAVAEGAETAEQVERAFALGVDAVQGRHLAEPMASERSRRSSRSSRHPSPIGLSPELGRQASSAAGRARPWTRLGRAPGRQPNGPTIALSRALRNR